MNDRIWERIERSRERWDVLIYCGDRTEAVPCGSLREGVSRDIASRVFEAVRRAAAPA